MRKDFEDNGALLCGRSYGKRISVGEEVELYQIICLERRKLIEALCEHPLAFQEMYGWYRQSTDGDLSRRNAEDEKSWKHFRREIWQSSKQNDETLFTGSEDNVEGTSDFVLSNQPSIENTWYMVGAAFETANSLRGKRDLVDAILMLRPKDILLEDILDKLKRTPLPRVLSESQSIRQTGISARRMRASKDKLVMANQGLVSRIVRNFSQSKLTHADLWQEGRLGLVLAVERFDPSRGHFGALAGWWVAATIREASRKTAETIYVPHKPLVDAAVLKRQVEEFRQNEGRSPSVAELAGIANLSVRKVEQLQSIPNQPTSFDHPVGEERTGALVDALMEQATASPEQECIESDKIYQVRQALTSLPTRSADILRHHFEGEKSLEQIGASYNVTRERIRQIEAKALKTLKPMLEPW